VTATVLLSFPLIGLYEAGILADRVFPGKASGRTEEPEDGVGRPRICPGLLCHQVTPVFLQ